MFHGGDSEASTTGGRARSPCASPRAPCRDERVERLAPKIGWPSWCLRRVRVVTRGQRLRKRRATVSATRVARSYGLPEVVSSAVVVVRCHPRRCGGRRGVKSSAAVKMRPSLIVGEFGLLVSGLKKHRRSAKFFFLSAAGLLSKVSKFEK